MRNECGSAISGGSRSQVDLQNAESAKGDDDVSVVRPSQYPERRSMNMCANPACFYLQHSSGAEHYGPFCCRMCRDRLTGAHAEAITAKAWAKAGGQRQGGRPAWKAPPHGPYCEKKPAPPHTPRASFSPSAQEFDKITHSVRAAFTQLKLTPRSGGWLPDHEVVLEGPAVLERRCTQGASGSSTRRWPPPPPPKKQPPPPPPPLDTRRPSVGRASSGSQAPTVDASGSVTRRLQEFRSADASGSDSATPQRHDQLTSPPRYAGHQGADPDDQDSGDKALAHTEFNGLPANSYDDQIQAATVASDGTAAPEPPLRSGPSLIRESSGSQALSDSDLRPCAYQ